LRWEVVAIPTLKIIAFIENDKRMYQGIYGEDFIGGRGSFYNDIRSIVIARSALGGPCLERSE